MAEQATTLGQLAKTVRSKNAGTDRISFDLIFNDAASYIQVRDSGVLTRESVSALYRVAPQQVVDFVTFDAAMAIKFTIQRDAPSGSPGERDIFGCQQYPPLLGLVIQP